MTAEAKILLITGGSRGIGAAIAQAAAARSFAVAVNYRSDRDAAERLVSGISAQGGTAAAFQADVGREDDIMRLFAEVDERMGRLSALVNNAGISGDNTRTDAFSSEGLNRLMAVNVVGPMLCCREAVRRMSTAHGGTGGAIVNISSMAVTIGGRPQRADYAASKAAIDVYTVGLAKEVAQEGIRVNAVRPGVVYSDMTAGLKANAAQREAIEGTIAMNRIAEATEVAAPVLWLLSQEASFISGCRLEASGGGFVFSS